MKNLQEFKMFQISGKYNFKLLNFFSYSLQKSVIISSHLNMLKENLNNGVWILWGYLSHT